MNIYQTRISGFHTISVPNTSNFFELRFRGPYLDSKVYTLVLQRKLKETIKPKLQSKKIYKINHTSR